MGRKRASKPEEEPKPPEPKPPEPEPEREEEERHDDDSQGGDERPGKTNKMAAVREVLADDPDASPADIVEALAKQGLDINAKTASVYKSNINKKAKDGNEGKDDNGNGQPKTRRKTQDRPAQQPRQEPSLSDLLALGKWLSDKAVSPRELREQVQDLRDLSEQCGGLDGLLACLDALETVFKLKS